ncbi:DUF3143 domain-containing protein [Leptolyngbya sp. AN02str]|uniref:DUF3143 domain-containing protein n=1 Tax=Leptolyngbya sp. AN02str TaxID=3423363 RepID=UPI003D31721D
MFQEAMSLPPPETPLYNHPLPDIEAWLLDHGCQQNTEELHIWSLRQATWQAELIMDVDALTVRYIGAGDTGEDIVRTFKYSLSRQDLDDVIFSGP